MRAEKGQILPITDPYFDAGGNPKLRKSVVVVADILGFKELTRQAFEEGSQKSLLEILYGILSYEYSGLADPSKAKWRLKVYSDNLILGYPLLADKSGSFEFAQACFSIAHYQLGMANRGYFIRGGIGIGEVHISDLIVFGKVLNEVSEADGPGTHPRVVFLESAVQHFAAIDPIPALNGILSTGSTPAFINYLGVLDTRGDSTFQHKVLEHKTAIEQRLRFLRKKSHAQSIRDKYEFLKEYHNNFCANSSHFNLPDLLIRL